MNSKAQSRKIEFNIVERCSGIQVRSGEETEELKCTGKLQTFEEINATKEQQRRREAGLMHERFIGVVFEKSFGECGIFGGCAGSLAA